MGVTLEMYYLGKHRARSGGYDFLRAWGGIRKKQGYIGEPNVTPKTFFFECYIYMLSVTFSRVKCYFFSHTC